MKKICSVLILGCLLASPAFSQSSILGRIFGNKDWACPLGSSAQPVKSSFFDWLLPSDPEPWCPRQPGEPKLEVM